MSNVKFITVVLEVYSAKFWTAVIADKRKRTRKFYLEQSLVTQT